MIANPVNRAYFGIKQYLYAQNEHSKLKLLLKPGRRLQSYNGRKGIHNTDEEDVKWRPLLNVSRHIRHVIICGQTPLLYSFALTIAKSNSTRIISKVQSIWKVLQPRQIRYRGIGRLFFTALDPTKQPLPVRQKHTRRKVLPIPKLLQVVLRHGKRLVTVVEEYDGDPTPQRS